MASINKNELKLEVIQKAMKCKTADELLDLAKAEGYEMTAEEAEGYLEELEDFELDEESLKATAGGGNKCYVEDGCVQKCDTPT